VFFPPGEYEGNVVVPNYRLKEGRISITSLTHMGGAVIFRGQKVHEGGSWERPVPRIIDIAAQLVFGSHRFEMREHFGTAVGVAVEAMVDPSEDRMYFDGTNLERVIVQRVLPLTDFSLAPELTGQGTGTTEQ
jgi:hypothetical protein